MLKRIIAKRITGIACALILLAFCRSIWADEVQLKNGDRITGTIVRMENKTLTVTTSYAGEIAIKWDQVETVETDSTVRVVLKDKTSGVGILKSKKDGERV